MASDEFLIETLLQGRPGAGMPSWRDLSSQEMSDLLAHLRSWGDAGADTTAVLAHLEAGPDPGVGARIFRARCADCHGRDGQGGVGPSLNNDAFLSIASDAYLAEAILAGRPGTAMPAWRGLTAADVGDLVAHVRGLSDAPFEEPPRHTAQGDPESGALLFQRACAACHGLEAVGGVGPQLRNPAFLAQASDGFLAQTIRYGRPGTAMRGFLKGGRDANGRRVAGAAGVAEFTEAQIADVVAWLRLQQHAPPTAEVRAAVLGSPSRGRELYHGLAGCASCHGAEGQGGVGPALGGREFLSLASEGFLIGTLVLGRHGTEMRRFSSGGITELETEEFMDVAAYVRTLSGRAQEDHLAGRASWRRFASTDDQIAVGRELYRFNCVSCHGEEGRGGYAPELNNPEFLAAASDGFLVATIARGRKETPMRPFGFGPASLAQLDHAELRAIVGYLRSWERGAGTTPD